MNEISSVATSIFIAVFFILTPLIILVICYKSIRKRKQVENKCTCSVKGVVYHVEITKEEFQHNFNMFTRKVTIYRPSVRYTVGDKTYTVKSSRANSKPINEGDEVTIHYDPTTPESFYIEGYKKSDIEFILIPLGFIIFGIIMFILTLWE